MNGAVNDKLILDEEIMETDMNLHYIFIYLLNYL